MDSSHVQPTTRPAPAPDDPERVLATLIGNLPGLVYRCRNDPDWTMEFGSEGCLAVTGYPASDLVGNVRISYGDLIHPDDRDWLWEKCQLNLERRIPCLNEYRIISASGDVRWVWDQARGIHDAEGELVAVEGFIQDITARKNGEDALQRAMTELDHRVKNNLAGVIALVNQTLGSASPEEFAPTLTGRIHAMARSHEALAASHWRGVEIGRIVASVLAPCDTSRLRIEGEAAMMPARVSGPLTMTLHELATNAMKHGALRDDHGRVEVRWQQGDEAFRLWWTESGGPPVHGTRTAGLGTSLIRGFIELELGGTVEHVFPRSGARCSMVIPLARGGQAAAAERS